jgi:hypothetical protein
VFVEVSDAAAVAGRVSAVLPVESKLQTASVIQNHQLQFEIARLKIEQGALEPVPAHGYAVAGDNPRGLPTSISTELSIELAGDFASGDWIVTPVTPGTTATCPALTPSFVLSASPGTPATAVCRVTREITPEEMNGGQRAIASVRIESDNTAAYTKALVMPIAVESMDVIAREVSSPLDANGYRVGDTVRWLVVVKNDGGVPVMVDSVGLSQDGLRLASPGGASSLASRLVAVSECALPATLAPGRSLTCTLSYIVSVPDVLSGSVTFSVVVGSAAPTQSTAVVRVLTATARALELPATGSSVRDLVAIASALVAIGFVLRRRSASAA